MGEESAVGSKTQFEFLRLPNIAQNLIIEQLDFLSYIKLKSCSKVVKNICNSSKPVDREFEVESISLKPYLPGFDYLSKCSFLWKKGNQMVNTPWTALEGNKDLEENGMRAKQIHLSRGCELLDDGLVITFLFLLQCRNVTTEQLVFRQDLMCSVGVLSNLIRTVDATSLKCKCLLQLNGILREGLLDDIDSLECDFCHHCPGCIMPPDLLIDLSATTLKLGGVRVHANALNEFFEQWQHGERNIDVLHMNFSMGVFDDPPEDLLFAGLDAVMVPGPVRPVTRHVSLMIWILEDSFGGVLWRMERPRANLYVYVRNSGTHCATPVICYQKSIE